MRACQPFKWSRRCTAITPGWVSWGHVSHSNGARRCTATHCLDGISWGHVSHSNGAQEVHSHSLPGWDFMGHVSHSNGAQEVHSHSLLDGISWGMSAIQMEPRRHTGSTQGLTCWMDFMGHVSHSMSQEVHATPPWMGFMRAVSHSNGAQEVHATHSLDGISWGHVKPFKWSPGGAQPLTCWMGFHGGMSAIKWSPGGNRGNRDSLPGWDSWGMVTIP